MDEIVSRDVVFETAYFSVVGKRVREAPGGDPFYSLALNDYVTIVAVTAAGEFVLVRQFRPAVESHTLELPAGQVDPGDTPEGAARHELRDETGFEPGELRLLGCLRPDTGRLGNRMWVYFAGGLAVRDGEGAERGVDALVMTPRDLAAALAGGEFDHALHVAALMLAVRAGCVALPAAGDDGTP